MKVAVITESSSEYGRRLVDGIAAYARTAYNWRLAWFNPESPMEMEALRECSGIIARIANDSIARRLMKTGLPVVDVFCRRGAPEFFGVNSDHRMIGRLAAEHFIEKRHVNFAFAGFRDVSFSRKRFEAFASRLKEHGYGVTSTEIPLPSGQRAFFNRNLDPVADLESLRKWLVALPKPSAVFAANDLLALAVSKAARESGLSIPEDIAVLGVDDDRLLCAFAETPISSIDPNAFGIGYTAARILSAIMKDPPKKSHPVHHVSPNGIVRRNSSERHAIKPDWLADTLGYIDSMIDRPLSTVDLVEFTGLSHVTISAAFRERLEMSPVQYITALKMSTARKMLGEGKLLVKEVAHKVGYASLARFSVVYKNYWGHPPSRAIR